METERAEDIRAADHHRVLESANAEYSFLRTQNQYQKIRQYKKKKELMQTKEKQSHCSELKDRQ